MKSTFAPVKQTRKEKIEAELKLLEWHKLANDAALKAALMQNKNVRESTPEVNTSISDANTKRIRKVITNEQTKPLEVTKDFVLKYEESEMKNSERLTEQVERHIGTLRKIREKLESKVELKERINEYREWKRDFSSKKHAIMSGKTLASLDTNDIQRTAKDTNAPTSEPSRANELAAVLDSLNKLAQIENRISDLEANNVYQKMSEVEEQRAFEANEKTALEFNKRRATGGGTTGPTRTVYAIRQKKVPLHQGATIRGGTKKKTGGTFLTEYGDNTRANDKRCVNYNSINCCMKQALIPLFFQGCHET